MYSKAKHVAVGALFFCLLRFSAPVAQSIPSTPIAQDEESRPRGNRGGGKGKSAGGESTPLEVRMPTPAFQTEVPQRSHDILLSRPTATSITASLLAFESMEGFLVVQEAQGKEVVRTSPSQLQPGKPLEIQIHPLRPNAQYRYRFYHRSDPLQPFVQDPERMFHTARSAGSSFTFSVQADSHLDYGTDLQLYRQSLERVLASQADFHVDLGDTFMTDKYLRYLEAEPQYLAQRYYFGLIGHSIPVYWVLGNHDGEGPGRGREGADMGLWSLAQRKRYFPNPVPDDFYSGNLTPHAQAGPLQDYYAWSWGDGLFVVLDPFWFSPKQRGRGGDNWNRTLGEQQYRWLVQLLEAKPSRFTFVFIHHLVGGQTPEGRGGAEASRFFEWGGREAQGQDLFGQKRPGWPAPIHDLLSKRTGVIVFHGHDHFFAHQIRDGVTYQLVPQPGHRRGAVNSAAEYGYRDGTILPGSGVLQVHVSPRQTQVDFLRVASGSAPAVSYSYKVVP